MRLAVEGEARQAVVRIGRRRLQLTIDLRSSALPVVLRVAQPPTSACGGQIDEPSRPRARLMAFLKPSAKTTVLRAWPSAPGRSKTRIRSVAAPL